MNSPLERDEQSRIVSWAHTIGILRWPHLAIDHPDGLRFPLKANINERKVKPHVGRFLKAQGALSGWTDLEVPVSRDGFSSLCIELKRIKPRGTVSPAQKAVIKWLNNNGHLAIVCYGADEAIRAIEEYLG